MVRELKSHRVVLKIGTSTLTNKDGSVNEGYIQGLACEVSKLLDSRKEIVIVTSGAIGAGCAELGLKERVKDVQMRQATAAIGQSLMIGRYHSAFKSCDKKVAQILLTYDDFSDRKRYVNLKSTLDTLLKMGVVPIINENDPISIDEIGPSFGDNDKLSALVASKVDADLLIIMSDIDGFYDKDPKKNKDAKLLCEVKELSLDVEGMAGNAGSAFGLGGMKSKIEAIKVCSKAGVAVVICNGSTPLVVSRILAGEELGTLFIAGESLDQKKRWVHAAKAKGKVIVDEGARKAIISGKNLLPAGIKDIVGQFKAGDVVDIVCGAAFAKAIVDYSSDNLRKIMGKKSAEVVKILSGAKYENVVRRENLVIL